MVRTTGPAAASGAAPSAFVAFRCVTMVVVSLTLPPRFMPRGGTNGPFPKRSRSGQTRRQETEAGRVANLSDQRTPKRRQCPNADGGAHASLNVAVASRLAVG